MEVDNGIEIKFLMVSRKLLSKIWRVTLVDEIIIRQFMYIRGDRYSLMVGTKFERLLADRKFVRDI